MPGCTKWWRQFVLGAIWMILASCRSINNQPTQTPTQQVTPSPTPSPSPTVIVTALDPPPTNEPIVEGIVSLWLDWSQAELAVLVPHLAAFQEMFPGIQISISYFSPDELLERYLSAAGEGQEPTILLGPSEWTRILSQDGYLRDIHERTTQDFIETIQPSAWEGVTRSPFILGLPFSMEGIVLFRNKQLITQSPQTLDELVKSSETLEGDEQLGIMMDVGFLYTGAFLQACDAELLGPNGNMLLTVEAGNCWLEVLNQLRLAGSATQNSDQDLEAFKASQTAWLVDGTWNAQQIMTALGSAQIAVDPWPIYTPTSEALTGYTWSRNFFFGSSSTEQDFNAAWILARYLLTPEVQTDFGESTHGLHIPVLRSVPTVQPWLQEIIVVMGNNIPLPHIPELSIFSANLEVAAYDVSRRGYDPYYAILWAHPKIEKALRYVEPGEE